VFLKDDKNQPRPENSHPYNTLNKKKILSERTASQFGTENAYGGGQEIDEKPSATGGKRHE
jgi:hypothetical protein